jgi:hypothetical protein
VLQKLQTFPERNQKDHQLEFDNKPEKDSLLKIPNAFALVVLRFETLFMFQHKGHYKINNDGRAKSKKRQIDKIHPDMSGLDTKFFSPPFTNTKCLLFEPIYNFADHFHKYNEFVSLTTTYRDALSKNSATLQ